jgi:hypothetical protein
MNELNQSNGFNFDLDLSGRPTFAIAYKPKNMDNTPLTGTTLHYSRLDGWANTFIHECFHHYQYNGPESDWISFAWGGLSTSGYPVTVNNIALALLEKYALIGGRKASSISEKNEALRRVLAIRSARVKLYEAAISSFYVSSASKTHGQGVTAPDGVGQSFTANINGKIQSIKVNVMNINNPNVRLELWNETKTVMIKQIQFNNVHAGENILNFDVPQTVDTGIVYSFRLFPTTGFLSLWSASDSYAGGETFFITNSRILRISPTPDLTFEINKPSNYIDLMDRYQERNEGSAFYVSFNFFNLSKNTVYSQEMSEQLDRNVMYLADLKTRDQIMSIFFQGGWYVTGATIIQLLDEVYGVGYRKGFPAGGSPIESVSSFCGPLSQAEMDQLVVDAKAAYNWQYIMSQATMMKTNAGL